MNILIDIAFFAAYATLGWYARGNLASAWWRGQTTIAEARVTVLEGELKATQATVQVSRNAYLARLERCEGCATCNPEPQGFDLIDYEFGAPE